MFKYLLKIILAAVLIVSANISFAGENTVLSAGISVVDSVPVELMGTWRVVSKLEATDSPDNFKKYGLDIWNLFRSGNVINLCNPYNGASASIRVEYAKDNTIKFVKEGTYDRQVLTDTVEITIDGNKFSGKNYLCLRSYSNVDNSLQSEKTAVYLLHGEKISGTSILER